jgi:hypothetical protein
MEFHGTEQNNWGQLPIIALTGEVGTRLCRAPQTNPATLSGARIGVLWNDSKYAQRIYDSEKEECKNERAIAELDIAVDRDSSDMHSNAKGKNKSSEKPKAQIPLASAPCRFHFI